MGVVCIDYGNPGVEKGLVAKQKMRVGGYLSHQAQIES